MLVHFGKDRTAVEAHPAGTAGEGQVNHGCRLMEHRWPGGSSSVKNASRPVCSAAVSVEPLPPNRSSTFSPGLEEYSIALAASSTGFSVRWIIACELTFLTARRSVALRGPKN